MACFHWVYYVLKLKLNRSVSWEIIVTTYVVRREVRHFCTIYTMTWNWSWIIHLIASFFVSIYITIRVASLLHCLCCVLILQTLWRKYLIYMYLFNKKGDNYVIFVLIFNTMSWNGVKLFSQLWTHCIYLYNKRCIIFAVLIFQSVEKISWLAM